MSLEIRNSKMSLVLRWAWKPEILRWARKSEILRWACRVCIFSFAASFMRPICSIFELPGCVVSQWLKSDGRAWAPWLGWSGWLIPIDHSPVFFLRWKFAHFSVKNTIFEKCDSKKHYHWPSTVVDYSGARPSQWMANSRKLVQTSGRFDDCLTPVTVFGYWIYGWGTMHPRYYGRLRWRLNFVELGWCPQNRVFWTRNLIDIDSDSFSCFSTPNRQCRVEFWTCKQF